MTTSPMHTDFEICDMQETFAQNRIRFRARTRNKMHSLLLEEFAKFSDGKVSAKSKLHEITGMNKSLVTRNLAAPRNLTLDTISDLLLAMGSRLEPKAVGWKEAGRSNYIHPASTLGSPLPVQTEQTTGTSASAVFEVKSQSPAISVASPASSFKAA